MKRYLGIFFLLLLFFSGFSQKRGTLKIKKDKELDSVMAASLIVGTWVDSLDPLHKVVFNPVSLQDWPHSKFIEKGIKSVSYTKHWDYFTKDSADTKFIDSTEVKDSSVCRIDSIWGAYWIEVHPLQTFSYEDTIGTRIVLELYIVFNGGEKEMHRRIFVLNAKQLKVQLSYSEHETYILKRKE
jgi:hypothetical protein